MYRWNFKYNIHKTWCWFFGLAIKIWTLNTAIMNNLIHDYYKNGRMWQAWQKCGVFPSFDRRKRMSTWLMGIIFLIICRWRENTWVFSYGHSASKFWCSELAAEKTFECCVLGCIRDAYVSELKPAIFAKSSHGNEMLCLSVMLSCHHSKTVTASEQVSQMCG